MMTKRDGFSEELYYGFSLEDKVPADHLLRRIKKAIDFSFVYDLVEKQYSHTGAPSIDPVVVFKLSLIGYLYNVSSERRLIEEASLNMAYLWFIDYKITEKLPDHSIFTKTRNRFGVDIYKQFFQRVVKACMGAGLIEGETAFLDATLIDANSRIRDVRSKSLVDRLNKSTSDFINKIFEENNEDEDLSGKKPKLPKRTNQRLSHPHDMDADIVRRKNMEAKLAYKGHIAVDGGKERVITAVALTGGATGDEHLLLNLLSQHEHILGKPKELVADQKYGTGNNFQILKAKGIRPAIKPYAGGKPLSGFTKDKFKYDKKNDCYICPQDKVIPKVGKLGQYKTYRGRKSTCPKCPIRQVCSPKQIRKTLSRGPSDDIFSWAREFLKTKRAKELLFMRSIWPETIFADAKGNHGMGKARFRGRWKVEIQVLMTASAINLKKLARQSGKTGAGGISNRIIDSFFSKFIHFEPMPKC